MADRRSFEDGKIHLHLNEADSPFWQYRIKVPGKANRFKRSSTKTANLEEAKKIAFQVHNRLEFRAEEGLPVEDVPFWKVAKRHLENLQRRVNKDDFSAGNLSRIRAFFTTHFLPNDKTGETPEFGEKFITRMSSMDCTEFFEELEDAGDGLSTSSLKTYRSYITSVFKTAVAMEVLTREQIPHIAPIKKKRNKEEERRPAFTREQVEALMVLGEDWAATEEFHKNEESQQNRLLCYDYVMFISSIGCRPGIEITSIKFKHITRLEGDADALSWMIHIPKGKTGPRITFCDFNAIRYAVERAMDRFDDIDKDIFLNPSKGEVFAQIAKAHPEEYVFRRPDGGFPTNMNKIFRSLIEACGIPLVDPLDREYSMYSLRHYYATQKVMENKVPHVALANYMGTSIAMFEQHYVHHEPMRFAAEVAKDIRLRALEEEETAKREAKKEADRDAKLDAILLGQKAILLGLAQERRGKPFYLDTSGNVVDMVDLGNGAWALPAA